METNTGELIYETHQISGHGYLTHDNCHLLISDSDGFLLKELAASSNDDFSERLRQQLQEAIAQQPLKGSRFSSSTGILISNSENKCLFFNSGNLYLATPPDDQLTRIELPQDPKSTTGILGYYEPSHTLFLENRHDEYTRIIAFSLATRETVATWELDSPIVSCSFSDEKFVVVLLKSGFVFILEYTA